MDNFVYNSLSSYFHTLSLTGYMGQKNVDSLLLLVFYYNFIYHDYRGYINKEDYTIIEKALNCLYGTNCLIPYPDYLKMGKLKLGEMTELATRVKNTEDKNDEQDRRLSDHQTIISDNTRRIDEHGVRLDDHDRHLSEHDTHLQQHDEHLELHDNQIADHEARVTTIENTKVVKGKNHIQSIPDIDLSTFDLISD